MERKKYIQVCSISIQENTIYFFILFYFLNFILFLNFTELY